jgi:hypothetical protein
MQRFDNRRFLLIILPLLAACLAAALIRAVVCGKKEQRTTSRPTLQTLPDDVERVMKIFDFRETDDGLQIEITGKQVVHRGREILGLRSNLVKATFFKNIRGTIRTNRMKAEFSADDGEWNTTSSSPMLLRGNVTVSINDRRISDVKNARIYLRQAVMEINGKQKKVIRLR